MAMPPRSPRSATPSIPRADSKRLTKNFACELVVSDETVSRAGLDLSGSPLHEIEIRGKREMLAVRIVERAAELPAAGAVPIRRIELVDA